MESYMKVKKMLCHELDYIADKGELTPRDLDFVDKITHSIKSLVTIMAMDEKSDYNGSSLYDSYDSYDRGNGYGMSGRRDSMGRFTSPMTRGYSRDESKSQMLEHLDKMMNETNNKDERETIQRIANELKTL